MINAIVITELEGKPIWQMDDADHEIYLTLICLDILETEYHKEQQVLNSLLWLDLVNRCAS